MTLPNLLLAGAPRCGTTSLFETMRDYEEIFIPEDKELWFFFNDELWQKGVEWYESRFSGYSGQKVVAEATPLYFCCPECLERIAATLPDVRLMLSFRNPIDRALSHYWLNVRKSKESLPLEQAFESDVRGERAWKIEKGALNYFGIGRYDEHLARIRDIFGPDRTHVIIFEELVADPGKVLADASGFMGLSGPLGESLRKSNRSQWLKSRRHGALYSDFPAKRLASGLLPEPLRKVVRGLRDKAAFGKDRPEPDERLIVEMAEYFSDSLVKLESMLGKSLDSWRSHHAFRRVLGE